MMMCSYHFQNYYRNLHNNCNLSISSGTRSAGILAAGGKHDAGDDGDDATKCDEDVSVVKVPIVDETMMMQTQEKLLNAYLKMVRHRFYVPRSG